MSDGTWTSPLPLDGKVKQITLGMPTLCPIGKKAHFRGTAEPAVGTGQKWMKDGMNLHLEWKLVGP